MTKQEYLDLRKPVPEHILSPVQQQAIIDLPYSNREYHNQEVVKMNKVSIRYGRRTILKELDWTVMNGERWALSGQTEPASLPFSALSVLTILKAMPATSLSSETHEEAVKAFGT